MKRREFSLSTASAVGACALALPVATPALAQAARQFKEGKDYRRLDKPVAPDAPAGKVDVIEFFWYSCPHCNAFEPKLEAWIKRQPQLPHGSQVLRIVSHLPNVRILVTK